MSKWEETLWMTSRGITYPIWSGIASGSRKNSWRMVQAKSVLMEYLNKAEDRKNAGLHGLKSVRL